MLLRDSEVAKDVRSYLLHAESQAPWRTKKAGILPAPQRPPAIAPGITKEEVIELLDKRQEDLKQEIHQAFQQEKQEIQKEQEIAEERIRGLEDQLASWRRGTR